MLIRDKKLHKCNFRSLELSVSYGLENRSFF